MNVIYRSMFLMMKSNSGKQVANESMVLTKLVVVDNEKKADEYLKWMFGPGARFKFFPSYRNDPEMILMEARASDNGAFFRDVVPVEHIQNGLFWRVRFKNIVDDLITATCAGNAEDFPFWLDTNSLVVKRGRD